MLKDIIEVIPQNNYKLYLKFEDGKSGIIDIGKFVDFSGVFEPLENLDYFKTVKVNPEWGTIYWDNGADLDPDVLYSLITNEPISIYNSLEKIGINWEEIKQEYQILILPENIEDDSNVYKTSDELGLIDRDDAIYLSKLLKESDISCANSYDLGLSTKVLHLRSIEINLGVIWIIDHACLPLVVAIIGRMVGDSISNSLKKNQANSEVPTVKAKIKVLDNNITSAAIDYNGNAQDFLKVLEGLKDET
ncbi:MAG: DUF2442 domain-containing protein [Crocosphaera sp.]